LFPREPPFKISGILRLLVTIIKLLSLLQLTISQATPKQQYVSVDTS
jgi:hypothetical protein